MFLAYLLLAIVPDCHRCWYFGYACIRTPLLYAIQCNSITGYHGLCLYHNSIYMYHSDKKKTPLTPTSDQDRISPYDIDTMSSRQVTRIKKNINWGIIN